MLTLLEVENGTKNQFWQHGNLSYAYFFRNTKFCSHTDQRCY